MKDKFIKFFLGKTTIAEEQKLMKWAKESQENEDELINSLNFFHMVNLLSDMAGETCIPKNKKTSF